MISVCKDIVLPVNKTYSSLFLLKLAKIRNYVLQGTTILHTFVLNKG